MYCSAPSVVNSSSRYARRFSSVDSTLIESNRFLIVPLDSSAARIPLPGATRARAVSCKSLMAAFLLPGRDRGHSGQFLALEELQRGAATALSRPTAEPEG